MRIFKLWLCARRVWAKLTRFGVTGDLPRNDVKHVIVTNVFILVGIGLMLVYPFVNIRVGHPAARIFAYVELVAAPVFAFGLYLNHRRVYWAAPTVFVLAGICTVTIGVMLVGKGIGSDLFYIVLAIVPFLVYPRSHKRLATLMAFFGLSVAMYTAARFSDYPAFGGRIPPDIERRSFMWSLGGLFLMLIIIGYHARHITQIVEDELDKERQVSERLLLNILPESIAGRLKETGGSIADHFEEVSVLFADIVGFTGMSEQLTPQELVAFLNSIFCSFDNMVERLGLEKIKTIGDAYMVAAGIPVSREDHAEAIMQLAVEMVKEAEEIETPLGGPLRLRIGINTGPVVSGVIGVKKFIYDLWGDTVNTASRMESHGEGGRIQVSQATYERLKHKYEFEARGMIHVKGKGHMHTWLLRVPSSVPRKIADFELEPEEDPAVEVV